jgi:hypothetical protein
MELIAKEDFHKVQGQIYKITNLITNKYYIGQTRSHYLNHGKYRPFGYLGRFKSHISESKRINKHTSCRYLNCTLLKYGFNNFICELILTCSITELDDNEVKYVKEYNSKFPNGYNLTDGGQTSGYLKGKKIILDESEIVTPLPILTKDVNPNLKRSDYTRNLISVQLLAFNNNNVIEQEKMSKRAQYQHLFKKFERYRNVIIDSDNIEKYLYLRNDPKYQFICVTIEKINTYFVGKFESIDETKDRARKFIIDLIKWQHVQIAGSSLEPSLPLTLGNICEEHG